MPYLTNVGPNDCNKSGLCSRGYHVYRRGKSLFKEWGQVIHVPKRKQSVVWKYKQGSETRHKSIDQAKAHLQKKIEELEKKQYRILGEGIKILSSS